MAERQYKYDLFISRCSSASTFGDAVYEALLNAGFRVAYPTRDSEFITLPPSAKTEWIAHAIESSRKHLFVLDTPIEGRSWLQAELTLALSLHDAKSIYVVLLDKFHLDSELQSAHQLDLTSIREPATRLQSAVEWLMSELQAPSTPESTEEDRAESPGEPSAGTPSSDDAFAWVIAFSPDGTKLAAAGDQGRIYIWDLVASTLTELARRYHRVCGIAWSPDGTELAASSTDNVMRVWDVGTKSATLLPGNSPAGACVAWSPDGTRVAAAGGSDALIHLWDVAGSQKLPSLEGHSGSINRIAWSPDSSRIASASHDKTVRVWNPSTGQCDVLEEHTDVVWSVAWDRDDTRLASCSQDGTVRVWDPRLDSDDVLTATGQGVLDIAWRPDGGCLASASFDRSLRIWDANHLGIGMSLIDSGALLSIPHPSPIEYVEWNRDGTLLATSTVDRSIRLWDARNFSKPPMLIDLKIDDQHPTLRVESRPPQLGSGSGIDADRAAVVDRLGYQLYARAFADMVRSPEAGFPLVVGIIGPWGIGKSTLLRLIRQQVGKDKSVHVVEFNAWEYNTCSALWPYFAWRVSRTVLATNWQWQVSYFADYTKRRGQAFVLDRGIQLVLAILSGALAAVAWVLLAPDVAYAAASDWMKQLQIGVTVTFALWPIAFIADLITRAYRNPLLDAIAVALRRPIYGQPDATLEDIRSDLDCLSKLVAKENRRVVVIVDDLDRCEPGKAVEMLQAINLLLQGESKPFCVFLGVDLRLTSRAIEAHYKDVMSESATSGFEYLEKIIQIPFRIPPPSPADLRDLVKGQMPVPVSDPVLPPVSPPRAAGRATAGARAPVAGSVSPIQSRPEAPATSEDAEERVLPVLHTASAGSTPASPATIAPRVRGAFSQDEQDALLSLDRYLRPNPRHVKRLVNIYRLVRNLVEADATTRYDARDQAAIQRNIAGTFRWLILCTQWPAATHSLLGALEERGWATADEAHPLLELYDGLTFPLAAYPEHERSDYDPTLLATLIHTGEEVAPIDLETLVALRRYTLSFNFWEFPRKRLPTPTARILETPSSTEAASA